MCRASDGARSLFFLWMAVGFVSFFLFQPRHIDAHPNASATAPQSPTTEQAVVVRSRRAPAAPTAPSNRHPIPSAIRHPHRIIQRIVSHEHLQQPEEGPRASAPKCLRLPPQPQVQEDGEDFGHAQRGMCMCVWTGLDWMGWARLGGCLGALTNYTRTLSSERSQGLCQRCHDKVEWRKKYRKYKPLTVRACMRACMWCV